MTFQQMVTHLQERAKAADVSRFSGEFALQIDLNGQEEEVGVFYVAYKQGKLDVQPYDYHDRDARIRVSMADLEKLLDGKLDPVFAFTVGRLKVEGSVEKALELTKV